MTPDRMTPEMLAELEKLRDIRMPGAVGWWPVAPGWWVLLALCCIAVLAVWLYEARRRRGLRHLALGELRALRNRLNGDDDAQAIGVKLAVLLRRVALSAHRGMAHVTGDAWVQTLTTGKAALSPDIARFVATAPYAPAVADPAILRRALSEAETWIRGQS